MYMVCTDVCIYIYMHIYIYTCIHIYIHIIRTCKRMMWGQVWTDLGDKKCVFNQQTVKDVKHWTARTCLCIDQTSCVILFPIVDTDISHWFIDMYIYIYVILFPLVYIYNYIYISHWWYQWFLSFPNSFYHSYSFWGHPPCQEAAGKVFHWEVDTVNQVPGRSCFSWFWWENHL